MGIKYSLKLKESLFEVLRLRRNTFYQEEDVDGITRFLQELAGKDFERIDETSFESLLEFIESEDELDFHEIFIEQLDLLSDDSFFTQFLYTILSSSTYEPDEKKRYFKIIQAFLNSNGLDVGELSRELDEPDNYIISKIPIKEFRPSDSDIPPNEIPFFVQYPSGNSNQYSSHDVPDEFPSIVLVFNPGWNDFSVYNYFDVFCYSQDEKARYVGFVKIMEESQSCEVFDLLAERFVFLPDNFCFLGQTLSFYEELKNQIEDDLESVLFALRDAAFFPEILEKFERKSEFRNSLIRYDEPERVSRIARIALNRDNLLDLYSFDYNFRPGYSKDAIDIHFDLDQGIAQPDNRVYGLIGKNGTGKTQLITKLPLDIANKNKDVFHGDIPLFSKVISVSYSVFDIFKRPTKTASFNYVYCGLRDEKGELRTERGLSQKFHYTVKTIATKERIDQWEAILKNFLDHEFVDDLIEYDENDELINNYGSMRNRLSSGQSILLYIISEIVANIRYDSLILYDEPETHLHPNAISQLINTIYDLVNRFQSYCIVATHSPLIIQEIPAKNVYVVERHENIPSVRKIGQETFAENLTTLTEVIFGNRNIPKQHEMIIKELVDQGASYENIIGYLETEQMPLSHNAYMQIRMLIDARG